MPGKTIKVDRNITLTFWERIYLPEIFRGLWITTRHFIPNWISCIAAYVTNTPAKRTINTLYYPEEKPVIPEAYRGKPVLVLGSDGLEKCVACGLCEAACPPKCITIEGDKRADGSRYPATYILDGSKCIFCGFCEEACPEEAIVMSHRYENLTDYKRERMVYDKKDLLVPEADLKRRLEFIRKRAFGKCNY